MGKFSGLAQIVKADAARLDESIDSATSSNTVKVSVASIFVSPLQYRKYIDPEQVNQLAASIRSRGLIQPIVVRPADNEYELVVGQKRFLAHQQLGLKTIEARVQRLTDSEVIALALIENIQRNNPNPVEETMGALALLSLELGLPQEQVISLFYKAANAKIRGEEGLKNDVVLQITDILKEVCGITPDAFRTHRLPLLKLPEEILAEIEQGTLEYSKARLLAGIKDPIECKRLLNQVLDRNMSVRDLKDAIAAIKANADEPKPPSSAQRFNTLGRKFKGLTDEKKRKRAEKLLQQLEDLLNEDS